MCDGGGISDKTEEVGSGERDGEADRRVGFIGGLVERASGLVDDAGLVINVARLIIGLGRGNRENLGVPDVSEV